MDSFKNDEMQINKVGSFNIDGEEVTGIFVECPKDILRKIPFNMYNAQIELHDKTNY